MDDRSPRERRSEKTREAILSTALELIVEKGSDGLSLREIARRIDYSPAGLYEYYGSKDEIIQAVCREADERLRRYLEGVRADAYGPTAYLLALGDAYLSFARENPEHYNFLFSYRDMQAEAERVETPEIPPDDTFMILFQAVQAAIDAGEIRTAPGFETMEISFSLWALGHGLATMESRFKGLLPFDFDNMSREAFLHYVESLK